MPPRSHLPTHSAQVLAKAQPRETVDSAPRACPKGLPRFGDYPADSAFHGQPRWPAVTLGPDSYDLGERSNLTLATTRDRAPDFAGYLRVVHYGCGSGCQVQMLVDVQRGDIVATTTTSLDAAYRLDSRLFIANPMDSTGCYDTQCADCRPHYFVWTGRTLDSLW